VVNYQENTKVQPVILNGISPLQVFRSHFDAVWNSSDPLGAIIAEQVVAQAGVFADISSVEQALGERCAMLHLDTVTRQLIIPHVAFRHSSSVIFIVGLPGAGKSFVRRRLAAHLKSLRIEAQELTDYVFAYRDFLHSSIRLEPPRARGFRPESKGAFRVLTEESLRPALKALSHRVMASFNQREVTLVEFARSDILAALQEFGDELLQMSQIIYVEASPELRAHRLRQRARPPELGISGVTVTVTVSDDHKLPSTVEKSIYSADDLTELNASRKWRDRIFRILNDADDVAQVDAAIVAYVNRVTGLYSSSSR
jgi:dephospho-CoA kinase